VLKWSIKKVCAIYRILYCVPILLYICIDATPIDCLFVWWCLMPLSTIFQLYRGSQSVLPSVQDIFLSNYWWQKSDIWSQDSYRYAILWEAFLDLSDSYFLFANLVGFYTHWTYMLGYHKWALAHSSPSCFSCIMVRLMHIFKKFKHFFFFMGIALINKTIPLYLYLRIHEKQDGELWANAHLPQAYLQFQCYSI
jgi:hypothetical protein